MCNMVKITVAAIAIGETIGSYYKSNDFRVKLNSSKGFDKVRVVFNNLLDVNKKFFTEASSVDYNARYNDLKLNLEYKINDINLKIDNIKENINDYSEEKLKPTLNDMYIKANEFREKLEDEAVGLNERYKLEEKLDIVKEKISDLKSKMKK